MYLFGLTVMVSISFLLIPVRSTKAETITVMHVSDTHTHLSAWSAHGEDFRGTAGGYARLASIIAAEREKDDELLLLNAGDNFSGDLVFNLYLGVPELELQKSLGFDAMAVGNHEFDLGPEILSQVITEAGMTPLDIGSFPLLCANLDYSLDTTKLRNLIQPYTVFTRHGIRIGVFSLLTPETMIIAEPFDFENGVGVIVRSDSVEVLLDIASQMVRTLRQDEQCAIVIALTHLGFLYDAALAENVPGIDLILGGHDHMTINTTIENVTGGKVQYVGVNTALSEISKVTIEVNEDGLEIVEARLIPIDENVQRADSIARQVEGIIARVEEQVGTKFYTEAICEAEAVITYRLRLGNETPTMIDTPLGNLVTDAMREFTGTDIAVEAHGHLRQDLPRGQLSEADLFQAVGKGYSKGTPLGYPLMTFELTGAELTAALEASVAALVLPYNVNFLIMCSGLSYSFDLSCDVGQRVKDVRAGGRPINPETIYTLTSCIELPLKMEKFFGIEVHNRKALETTLYEAFRDYCIRNSPISARSEGRVLRSQETPESLPIGQ